MDHDHWYELADDGDTQSATAIACNGVIDKAMKGRYYLRQTSFQSFYKASSGVLWSTDKASTVNLNIFPSHPSLPAPEALTHHA